MTNDPAFAKASAGRQIPMTNQSPNPNDQSLVLVIDTSGEKAFVALVRDGDVVGERTWEVSWDAGRQVLNVVDELLEGAGLKLEEIDRIGVGAGPGRHYSALRAGVTVANLLAYASGAEMVQLTSLDKSGLVSEACVAKPVKAVLPRYD